MNPDPTTSHRTETDALGELQVPIDAYSGIFAERARANFQISELRMPSSFKMALSWIKEAAALVNCELGHLEEASAQAIQKAAGEFREGHFDRDFDLDIYQAGAGTPFNMTINEILANRANEILGGAKGDYEPVHPNNHVNMAQSSNDVIPTAIRVAALMELKSFYESLEGLYKKFIQKAEEFKDFIKVGRTHLQDAVPVTLGQEFEAYASSLDHAKMRVDLAEKELLELGIGGTAIGTGINAHPEFAQKMCSKIGELTGFSLTPARNRIETTHSMAAFANLSAALKSLASELFRISNDLRLMASGPHAGLNELILPEVEPGSSIMPGKVNPSILECMNMICVQVFGLDQAISIASQQGQLELNWHTPLIGWNLLHIISILDQGMDILNKKCIQNIKADSKHMEKILNGSTAMATALAPYLGYKEVAELVQKYLNAGEGSSFKNFVQPELQKYLDPESMTKPNRD